MSDANLNSSETSELRAALADVAGADDQLTISLGADGEMQLSPAAAGDITESQVEMMRRRAKAERTRGIKNLEKRHEGIMSVMKTVVLNERVTGSAFERWFAAIEGGTYVLNKRGHMFVGEKNASALMTQLIEMVEDLEMDAASALAGVKTQLEMHHNADSLETSYASPAAEREVQLRTPLSLRVLKVIMAFDEVLSSLVKMHWNGDIEQARIEEQENKIKKGLRDLSKFLSRTIRGMRAKAEAKVPSAPALSHEAGAIIEQEAA